MSRADRTRSVSSASSSAYGVNKRISVPVGVCSLRTGAAEGRAQARRVRSAAKQFTRARYRENCGCGSARSASVPGVENTLLNVVDVEATCWDGQPPSGQPSEIVEIGLTVVDLAAGTRVGRHRILVKPHRSTVSAFCTELTGLTQAEVDTGLTFGEACRVLAAEHDAGVRPWASWGDY